MTKKSLRGRIAKALGGETAPSADPELVRELAKLLEETGLSEIEVERDGVSVRVARYATPPAAPTPVSQPPGATLAPAPNEAGGEQAATRGTIVTSPMVGTVFLAPQPGAQPFVKVGDTVKDETVCIVEAMKTMNPVSAPVAGRIAEIFVRDGQPVEFGEPLMRIE